MMKPSYERIRFLQNQLRTAIQNHHVLLLKFKISPHDTEIKNQMNILQSLIISMGRTQNDLLEQLERELENNIVAKTEVDRHLSWFIPKNVPIYTKPIPKSESVKPDENTKPGSNLKQPRVYSRTHSLLKPKDDDIKSDEAVWMNSKKLQSVLKNKFEPSKGFIRIQTHAKICGDNIQEEEEEDDDSEVSSKRQKTESEPNSRSSSVSPKPMAAPKERRKIVESKLWTRSKRRMAVAAATAAAKAASYSGNSEKDINELEESLKNEPIDPNVFTDEKILQNLNTYETLGKEKFLETFRLISVSERDAIRAKKCGRKRRTAAGQSNFYNDYFQHSALSMKNPKWRYEMLPVKRAPKEPCKRVASILDGSRRGSSPTDVLTSGEVTPDDKSSPKSSPTRDVLNNSDLRPDCETVSEKENIVESEKLIKTEKVEEDNDGCESGQSQNSVVVEAPDLEEEDKDKLCNICRSQDEESNLETCIVCNEKYHTKCSTSESEGRCKICFDQISGFKDMVGGDFAPSTTLDVIKRYLTL